MKTKICIAALALCADLSVCPTGALLSRFATKHNGNDSKNVSGRFHH